MTKHLQTLALVFVSVLGSTAVARTQDKPSTAAPKATITPLKVQVVISRYQGEKKVSSLPYTLSVNSVVSDRAEVSRLRMGVKVPVMMAMPIVDGKSMPAGGSIQYQDVGTNLDCFASPADEGRFKVTVTVEDTSVVGDERTPAAGRVPGTPAFRTFSLTNSAVLRDGQSAQFSSATDKVSGETVKIDVTLTVVK